MTTTLEEVTHELKVEVSKILYYKEETMWGIISVKPVETNPFDFEPEINEYGSFVIRGIIPMALVVGSHYDVEISELKTDAKYGKYYEIIRFKFNALDSVETQQTFLKAVLTAHQSNRILEAYPDAMVVDMIIDGSINLMDIDGFGEKTAKQVYNKIVDNKDLGGLLAEVADLKFTSNMIKKIVGHFKGSTMALAMVKKSLYSLCSVSGISFERVDKHALLRGENRFGGKRIGAYMEYYFDSIAQQGHSWAEERTFFEEATKELGIIGTYIRDYMRTDEGKEKFYWQEGDKRVSSMRMYNNEKNVFKHLLRIASEYVAPTNLKSLDEAINEAEESLGIKYTDEQRETIRIAIYHGVFILNGKGGTGKTTVVRGIVEVLQSAGLSCQACALSGKASQVLLSKGIESATIHRTFGIGMESDDGGSTYADVIVVDESSMINAGLFATVLKGIRSGSKVIIVGDSGQLSGIGHGDILRDLLSTKYFKTVELIQIHRQAQDSGIIEVASKIRDGKQISNSNTVGMNKFGVNNDMVMVSYKEKEDLPESLERVLRGQLRQINNPYDLMDFQVVVATRERGEMSAKTINTLAQSIFNNLEKPFVSGNGYEFREGDKVIVKGNTYELEFYDDMEHFDEVQNFGVSDEALELMLSEIESEEEKDEFLSNLPTANVGDLYNGTMGIVIKTYSRFNKKADKMVSCILVDFEGLGIVSFTENDLDLLELAYAVTCHRLQGSTIKNVVVVLDYSAFSLLSRQWVYTAITRASKKCVLLVQSSALVRAIAIDASGNRQTFLAQMITDMRNVFPTIEKVSEHIKKQAEISLDS